MEYRYVIRNGELCHFGIKGMRWGVRRYQNRDGSLTPLGKQRLAEKGIRTEENLSEKTIPKGTKMYRVTAYEKDGSQKSVYVSYKDADRNLYKAGTMIKRYAGLDKNADVYEHEMTLKQDIRVPSLKTVRDIEKRLIEDDKHRLEMGKSWIKGFLTSQWDMSPDDISEAADVSKKIADADLITLNNVAGEILSKHGDTKGPKIYWAATYIGKGKEWIKDNDYLAVERSLGQATGAKDALISELKRMGYNAMYDNAGIGVLSDGGYSKIQEGVEPLIIFDRNDTLETVNTRKVDMNEQRRSAAEYMQWKNEVSRELRPYR